MAEDARALIDRAPMSRLQVVAVGITMLLLALDGFDVLSISFAAPGIAAEWGIDRAALGVVLSMELFGMAAGALAIGALADRIGRRLAILGCLAVMATGMVLCAAAGGMSLLSAYRLLTGFGIGGMLTSANSMTAEFANTRRRSLCVSLTTIGYPVGAVIGGMIAAHLLAIYNWRAIFLFGSLCSLVCIPITLLGLPESPSFLIERRKQTRLNKLLARMGHEPTALPPAAADAGRAPALADLFAPALRKTTILLALAFFLHMTTFYFILKWAPKIVVEIGYTPSSAAGVLVWANVGGAVGGGIFGLLTARIPLRALAVGTLILSTGFVALFGRSPPDLATLSMLACIAGFFGNAAMAGLYTSAARAFPTSLRATGTGLAIGIGRGGAACSPILAGALFKSGATLPAVAALLACGSLGAALLLLWMGSSVRLEESHFSN